MKTFKQIKNISDSYSKMMRDLFPSSFDDEKLNNLLINIVFDDEKTIFINKLKNE
jgi:23S rRNA-/tRNA-specific pseudouridylate synthase